MTAAVKEPGQPRISKLPGQSHVCCSLIPITAGFRSPRLDFQGKVHSTKNNRQNCSPVVSCSYSTGGYDKTTRRQGASRPCRKAGKREFQGK